MSAICTFVDRLNQGVSSLLLVRSNLGRRGSLVNLSLSHELNLCMHLLKVMCFTHGHKKLLKLLKSLVLVLGQET